MDYELMMNGNVKIGQKAPDFTAETTFGTVNLENYKGKWVVLFSHPGDFTPVCTTEMIAFTKAHTYFKQINTELLGLSVDSNPSHLAWVYDIYCRTGVQISFPIIADRNGQTVRNVFIIDDKQIVRTILIYPMNVGRFIPEILRVVRALQVADCTNGSTPANWMPYNPVIVPIPKTYDSLKTRVDEIQKNRNGISWYLSFKEPETKCIQEQNCNTIEKENK